MFVSTISIYWNSKNGGRTNVGARVGRSEKSIDEAMESERSVAEGRLARNKEYFWDMTPLGLVNSIF